MDKTILDIWVGLFVAIGIAALMGLAMRVGNLTSNTLGETYTITANYENIGGLKPRAPVKSSGVVVGRIDKIQFDTQAYQAVVTLKIDKRYPFPKDTFANIYTSGLLGEQYISLEAGGDDHFLKEGDRVSKTQDAVVLEKLISQFLYSKASEESKK
ncbi:MAG: outer membrane lipid asymmetry maintenance protein MlaD [Candidatus Methylopumilus sp.]|nr:outer membrane lipid asymmetry maintenance protein MlaD [Betaproteobacteria bacterium]